MTTRPTFIDLRSQSHGPMGISNAGLPSPSLRSLPSPRLHVAGDIPPELSPLDAFAAQSRLLARQLNESTNGGKRISRLPPLTIANSLGQNRLGGLRSASAERLASAESNLPQSSPTDSPASAGPGQQRTEVEAPIFRPVSVHPEVGKIPDAPVFDIIPEKEDEFRGRMPPPSPLPRDQGIFGARRDLSPAPIDQDRRQPQHRPGRSPSDAPYRGRLSPQPSRSPSAPHQGRSNLRPERSPSAPYNRSGRSPRPGRSPSGPHNDRSVRPERSPSAPQQGRMGRPGRSPSDGPYRGPRSPRPGRSPSDALSRPSQESMRQRALKGPDGSLAVGGYGPRALAPPRAPFAQRAPSSRSMSVESSDDDHSLSHNSPQRKLSSTSAMSSTPNSPSNPSVPRSPSVSSEYSVDHTHLPRPAFNFSRPISRSSNHPAEDKPAPSRQASSDSQPSFILTDDTAHTPVSMHSEGFPDNNLLGDSAVPSYVYSKFSLPRGKMLQRNSAIFQEGQPQSQFVFEQQPPAFLSNTQTIEGGPPPSPPSRPSTSRRPDVRPTLEQGSPEPTKLAERGRSLTDPSHHPSPFDAPPVLHKDGAQKDNRAPSVASTNNTTIKARSQHSLAPSAEMSGEEHVTKAIEFHEAGSLTKSTYHLRLAARQNHPTGMLLYALACRHGWGMRPNQREGVAWLRKAVDSASLEVADDEDTAKDGKSVDVLERKTRKAQFALSIYELGVSHMNGWGIEQDKVLALRCFEIAGTWGDGDALAEAGFCYAQGVGCKKDLKKSAKFYRAAESKGISMIGNSWIYKSKYNDDGKDDVGGSPSAKKGGKDGHKRHRFGRTK
ncbi:hypothetical protein sscle_04g040150 [Sclerotinia sclerotiorum 1980 UF-70]|uniref:Cell cycle inhibitor Nif1 n=1 Tax=Sclerotinia sclerotiorum (strain ATCC 18683 / 1980 / Ss-1) TaxID=665079 RepID=A0A1D9Q2R9_SCLS1|nr:hypothetical protein sscle_04g040150 [Sclerotinia sclerotiorum 1980 UF-70]